MMSSVCKDIPATEQASQESDKALKEVDFSQEESSTALTQELVVSAWKRLPATYASDPRLQHLLNSHKPTLLEGSVLLLCFENDFQLSDWQSVQAEVERGLRVSLKNKHLRFKTRLLDAAEIKVRAYTSVEKFSEMSKKNKVLLTLKERLDLEF